MNCLIRVLMLISSLFGCIAFGKTEQVKTTKIHDLTPNNTVIINDTIVDLKPQIDKIYQMTEQTVLNIVIDTNGGSLQAVETFLDVVDQVRANKVETRCYAKKAISGGFTILNKGCEKRYLLPNAILLEHEAQAVLRGGVIPQEVLQEISDEFKATNDKRFNGLLQILPNASKERFKKSLPLRDSDIDYLVKTNYLTKITYKDIPSFFEVNKALKDAFKLAPPMNPFQQMFNLNR